MSTAMIGIGTTVSRADFVAHADEWLRRLDKGGPLEVLGAEGEPSALVLTLNELDAYVLHLKVREAMEDVAAGRLVDHETAMAEIEAEIGARRRSRR